MGATEAVNVVGENLDPTEGRAAKILEKRKAELERALNDVENSHRNTKGGPAATS